MVPNFDKVFHFKWSKKEITENLLELKKERLEEYYKIMDTAERIKYYVEKENLQGLEDLLTKNIHYAHFFRCHIEWAFETSIRNGNDSFVCFFIKYGYPLKNNLGIFSLIDSSKFYPMESNADMLTVFLENGADPNTVHPKSFKTPLHLAAEFGLPQMVSVLIKWKANVNSFDKKKKLPINYAEEHREDGERYEEVIKTLRENGSIAKWSNPEFEF